MKNLILLTTILTLSLVGSFSFAYADGGDYLDSFLGTDGGGTAFVSPNAVAVDNNDRIIVVDGDLIQIYTPDGSFVVGLGESDWVSFIVAPTGVAVDNNNRIIVTDSGKILIYDSTGVYRTFFDGSNGATPFVAPSGVAVDSDNRIIVTDDGQIKIYSFGGAFITSFDGTDGGTQFVNPSAVAVDSINRIIVADGGLVQIFNPDGLFFGELNGGDAFGAPSGVAVDIHDRIIVADGTGLIQIFNPDGSFYDTIDTKPFESSAVAVDSNNRIIVAFDNYNWVLIGEGFSVPPVPPATLAVRAAAAEDDKNGSGCSGDCTPPTIGLDLDSKRIVENGFSYNNNPVDVIAWHTPYPLITAIVNQTNTVEITVFDNQGIFYLDMVQFGLGLEDFGQAIHDVEVLIEVHLEPIFSENQVIVEKVVIRDRDNLIDTFSVFAVTETVQCSDDGLDNDCLKVTLEYSYREATFNNMMVVNVMDNSRNTQNFYLNDGVEVIGESMNPAPTYTLPNKKSNQQTENLTLTLTRTDKVNNIWMDENGIEYLKVSDDRFDRVTPITSIEINGFKVNQDHLKSGQSRLHSNFGDIVNYEKLRAVQYFDSSLIQGTLDDSIGEFTIVHVVPRLEKLGDSIEIEHVKAQDTIDELMNPAMIYR